MVRIAFRQSANPQQLLFRYPFCWVQLRYLKAALGQGSGFVHGHDLCLGQRLQIIAALDQNSAFGRTADSPEEAQGHRNHQRAGAGNNQEDKRPVNPLTQRLTQNEGREECKQNGGDYHRRGIPMGELGDKVFAFGLFAAGIFHQVENLCHRRFPKFLRNPTGEHSRQVNAPADDIAPRFHLSGDRFAGQGRGVHRGGSLRHHAVQGYLFPCPDDNGIPYLHLIGINLGQRAVYHDVGVIGPDIHQPGDGPAGTPHRVALEQLAHLVEQHDGHALLIFAGGKGPHRCQRH